ncbi:hypothetical protein V8C37DRAFT_389166 [Trichoderma ceciliae]
MLTPLQVFPFGLFTIFPGPCGAISSHGQTGSWPPCIGTQLWHRLVGWLVGVRKLNGFLGKGSTPSVVLMAQWQFIDTTILGMAVQRVGRRKETKKKGARA